MTAAQVFALWTVAALWAVLAIMTLIGHRRTRFPELVLLTGIGQLIYVVLLVAAAAGYGAPWYVNVVGAAFVPLWLIANAVAHLFYKPIEQRRFTDRKPDDSA